MTQTVEPPVAGRSSQDYWSFTLLGVSVAGGFYGMLVSFVFVGWHAFDAGSRVTSVASAIGLLLALAFGFLACSFYGFAIGFLYSAFVCGSTCLLGAWIASRVTRVKAGSMVLASCVGGACGWLCWGLYFLTDGPWRLDVVLLGPVLASLMGQAGGVAGALRVRGAAGIGSLDAEIGQGCFGLRDLFGLTTLASVCLTFLVGLSRLGVAPIELSLALTGVWLCVQLPSMAVGLLLLSRWQATEAPGLARPLERADTTATPLGSPKS
ncbi:MAG: hypothetical protein AAGA92_15180 [Planctomycetota bacterium]